MLIRPPQSSWPPGLIRLPLLSVPQLEPSELQACAVGDGMSEMRHIVDDEELERCRQVPTRASDGV